MKLPSLEVAGSLFEQAPFPVAIVRGPQLVLEFANAQILKLWGKDKGIVGKPVLVGLPEIQGQGFDGLLEGVLRSGDPFFGHEHLARLVRTPEGELEDAYFNFVFAPLRLEDGTIEGVFVSGTEVTEQVRGRHRVERLAHALQEQKRALQESDERFRTLAQETSHVVWFSDGKSFSIEGLPSWTTFTGQTVAEQRGLGWLDALHPDDRGRVIAEWQKSVDERSRFRSRYRLRRADGAWRDVDVIGTPTLNPDGTVREWIGTVNDITDQIQLEARLALAERLTSIGTMAAGVGHEINNPLAYATSNVSFALEELRGNGLSAEVLTSLEETLEGLSRVSRIVRDLRAFSRLDEGEEAEVDVVRCLTSALTMASNEIRHRASVVRELRPVAGLVANEGRLSQVFLNLLTNAAHALPEGRADENTVFLRTYEDQGAVVVEVEDTGVGIAPENLGRIFDPFFTTKPVGSGTGLGLSVSHGIVEKLGGRIEVRSRVGEGTCFKVVLPLRSAVSPDVARPIAGGVPEQPRPAVRPSVFVIDDEPAIGTSLQRLLSREFDVSCFVSAREVLQTVTQGTAPSVILCDVMMPDLTAAEFHAALLTQAPAVADRVIFITGGAFTGRTRAFLERPDVRWVGKPFDVHALKTALYEVAARRETAA